MPSMDEPYFVDNGAYSAWRNGEEWDKTEWVATLDATRDMPREPDFIVLPDVYQSAEETYERGAETVSTATDYGWPVYFAVQDGMAVETAVRFAEDKELDGIFVGGSQAWKRRYAGQFIMTAHDYGLHCHIGKPGDIYWAYTLGVDSVDTTSIVRNQSYDRLRRVHRKIEQQTQLKGY